MHRAESHIRSLKLIGSLWLIIFALSPCTVKDLFFYSVNTANEKPLNKSRATPVISFCSISNQESLLVSAPKGTKTNKELEPLDLVDQSIFDQHAYRHFHHFSKETFGNSPPKYILYKRLKIAAA